MKYSVFLLSIFAVAMLNSSAVAQKTPDMSQYKPKFGVKGGYNYSKLYGSSASFKSEAKNGFMVAVFYSAGGGTGMGYRTELVFSRQGFSYDSTGSKIKVKQDYIYLPQFTTFNIGKFLQFQAGAQLGLLINAEKAKDSSGARSTDIMDLYNKIDYGVAAGVEIYPFKGLIIGARYNLSLGNMYKRQQDAMSQPGMPYPLPFNPDEVKGKNAVINLFAGYRF
jgi:hypothetical protein